MGDSAERATGLPLRRLRRPDLRRRNRTRRRCVELGMDPIERAAIVDEGYDPDDPAVHAALADVVRTLGEHRHLTNEPELSIDHLVNTSRSRESGCSSDARR